MTENDGESKTSNFMCLPYLHKRDNDNNCSSSGDESVGDKTETSEDPDSSDSCDCDHLLDNYNYLDDSNLTEEKRLKIE